MVSVELPLRSADIQFTLLPDLCEGPIPPDYLGLGAADELPSGAYSGCTL